MNTFGIDPQETGFVIVLREDGSGQSRFRTVRQRLDSNPGADGRAVPANSVDSWRAVVRLLTDFLGGVPPTASGGYRIAAAVHGGDPSVAISPVQSACVAAGMIAPLLVPSTHALLCRWLTDPTGGASLAAMTGERSHAVTVVASGRQSTSVATYRIELSDGRPERFRAGKCSGTFDVPVGSADWTNQLFSVVRAHQSEPDESINPYQFDVAADELGARMFSDDPDRPIRWTGPGSGLMHGPLELSFRECRQWPAAVRMESELPDAIRSAGAMQSGRSSVTIVGGPGAAWPFVAAAARGAGPVWQSAIPAEDFARGASWLPALPSLFDSPEPSTFFPPGSANPICDEPFSTPAASSPKPFDISDSTGDRDRPFSRQSEDW